MKYLIDTDWAADWLKGRSEATQLLDSLRGAGLAVSIITVGELYEGVLFGPEPRRSERALESFLRAARALPLSMAVVRRFARIRGELRAAGLPVGDMDLFIAATALHHGLMLVSRNTRHFARIPGLQLYEP